MTKSWVLWMLRVIISWFIFIAITLYKYFSCLFWQIYFIDQMVFFFITCIGFFSVWNISSGYCYKDMFVKHFLQTWRSWGQLLNIWIFFHQYMPRGVSWYLECHIVIIRSKFWLIIQKIIKKQTFFWPNISVINDFLS